MNISQLKRLKESEDNVEFKEAKGGSFSFNGGSKPDPKRRRRCIVGYVIAFANEGGGYLVFGVHDKFPHQIIGSNQSKGAVGKLEQDIYNETSIRVEVEELFEEDKRVLIIKIPSRPAGRVYKFEDVPLMRIGEELRPMSDKQYLKIIQEQEPDFSERICEGLTLSDLDQKAIQKMKEAYSEKQGNKIFLTQDTWQTLSDLQLIKGKKITYAALILLGKEDIIKERLPQAAVFIEYRNDPAQITFDNRHAFNQPYYLAIEEIWDTINIRNGKVPVQQGPYIFDIPYFNEEVIRESVHNAVAHRDYNRSSEVLIKLYPQAMDIISPGGFPLGVNLKNLISVSSTPRNRLLADVLSKTGLVERSGQGVDKIFYQSISEAKGKPDYSYSDDFQVELRLSAIVKDKAFALFIKQLQKERGKDDKLSIREILTLEGIREGKVAKNLDKKVVQKLLSEKLIEKVGKTSSQKLILSKIYYSFTNREADYTRNMPIDEDYVIMKVTQHLEKWKESKMGKFVELFKGQLTREQVKNFVYSLMKAGFLDYSGTGSGRTYFLGKRAVENSKLFQRAIEIGLEQMKKTGELNRKGTEKTQKGHKKSSKKDSDNH